MENIPGHRDHHSDDHDQLTGIIPERVIAIIPELVIGMARNTDRHRPESPDLSVSLKKLGENHNVGPKAEGGLILTFVLE